MTKATQKTSTTAAAGGEFRVERTSWGAIFHGTRDSLIAEGIVSDAYLPTGRKRVRYAAELNEEEKQAAPGDWYIERRAGGVYKFTARRTHCGEPVYWSPAWENTLAKLAPPASDDSAVFMRQARNQVHMGEAFASAFDVSPARLNAGDTAMYWRDDDDGGGDGEVEIVEDFGVVNVTGEGKRLGYVIRWVGGDGRLFFAAAHHLLERDYSVRHLRLVSFKGAHHGG